MFPQLADALGRSCLAAQLLARPTDWRCTSTGLDQVGRINVWLQGEGSHQRFWPRGTKATNEP